MFSQYPNLATAGRTTECCPNVQTMPIKSKWLHPVIAPFLSNSLSKHLTVMKQHLIWDTAPSFWVIYCSTNDLTCTEKAFSISKFKEGVLFLLLAVWYTSKLMHGLWWVIVVRQIQRDSHAFRVLGGTVWGWTWMLPSNPNLTLACLILIPRVISRGALPLCVGYLLFIWCLANTWGLQALTLVCFCTLKG